MTEDKKEEKTEKKSNSAKATTDKDVSKSVVKLVKEIKELSVMELADLVNTLQDELGISATPVAAAAPAAGAVDGGEEADSDDAGGGTVVITAVGDQKIQVIKAIREIDQNVTLSDAKGMTESLPAEVMKDGKPEDAKKAVEVLEAAGATVEVK